MCAPYVRGVYKYRSGPCPPASEQVASRSKPNAGGAGFRRCPSMHIHMYAAWFGQPASEGRRKGRVVSSSLSLSRPPEPEGWV
jgi:hypothetical protein